MRYLMAGLTTVILGLVYAFYFNSPMTNISANSVQQGNLIANLGGMPVSIPPHFAEYVQYDDGPRTGEERISDIPLRTPESSLRSFGFYARFPDMAGLTTTELKADKRQKESSINNPWLSLRLSTGKDYPGDGFLDRLVQLKLDKPNTIFPLANYEKLSQTEYGLEVYRPAGTDPSTNQPYSVNAGGYEEFVFRNEFGVVETSIQCRNLNNINGLCEQTFSLEPDAKSVVVVTYRRNLLQNWRSIQDSLKKLILTFKLDSG